MAINGVSLRLIAPYIKGSVLSLGYPDILVPAHDIERWYGIQPQKFTDNGGWHGERYPLPETMELFSAFGAQLTCVDVHASRGCEIIADLNYDNAIDGTFDLVIDAGTTEHCFNVGQALMNAACAVKAGGVIFHGSPMTMVNHGFYNFNPTLFHDFYTQNGWQVLHMSVFQRDRPQPHHAVNRFASADSCGLYFLARRVREGVMRYPTQSKYLINPELKVANA